MNKKTIIITISSIALVGAGIGTYFYFRNKSKNDGDSAIEDAVKDAEKSGGAFGEVDESEYSAKNKVQGDKELKFGSKGRKVAMLQALLNYYYGQKIKIDGAFGQQVRVALTNAGWKFRRCIASAEACKVTPSEFVEMLKKTKGDTTFKNRYNPKTNSAIKAVYNKYSS